MGPGPLGAVDGHGDLASRASGFSLQRKQQKYLLRLGDMHDRGIISSDELKIFSSGTENLRRRVLVPLALHRRRFMQCDCEPGDDSPNLSLIRQRPLSRHRIR